MEVDMWTNKPQQAEVPAPSPRQEQLPQSAPVSPSVPSRPSAPVARNLACLGNSLEIKGTITGNEDMQIDGRVEGPISLQGQRLTVGGSGQLNSQINAREIVVYGKVTGNLRARDRVEIKKDGSVIGDITTATISIEDGAYFKGRIEIDRGKTAGAPDPQGVNVPVLTEAI
jgi:cytoskeletal protein CcmA (bactofilin family)